MCGTVLCQRLGNLIRRALSPRLNTAQCTYSFIFISLFWSCLWNYIYYIALYDLFLAG